MLIASGLLALLIGAAFAVLLSSVADLRALERRARRSEEVLVVANLLERLVVDLETAQRGFVITGQERFLEPWRDARTALPGEGRHPGTAGRRQPEQQERARRIVQATGSYLRDYSVPLVTAARRDPAAARTVAATDEGRRRMDAIRAEFDRFVASERWPGGGARAPLGRGRPARDRRRGGWPWRVDPAHRPVRRLPDPGDRAAGPPGGGHGRPARRRRPRCAHGRARRR